MTRDRAEELRNLLALAAQSLDDEDAAKAPCLFEPWQPGKSYTAGQRVRYNGELYKVLQGHTSQSDWAPEAAVSLFTRVLPGQDGTKIGEWVRPDSTNTYKIGDRVYHNGKLWESVVDGPNSWEPGVFGWEEVEE